MLRTLQWRGQLLAQVILLIIPHTINTKELVTKIIIKANSTLGTYSKTKLKHEMTEEFIRKLETEITNFNASCGINGIQLTIMDKSWNTMKIRHLSLLTLNCH